MNVDNTTDICVYLIANVDHHTLKYILICMYILAQINLYNSYKNFFYSENQNISIMDKAEGSNKNDNSGVFLKHAI